MEEIRPEMLKALDAVGLSWLKCLCGVTWRSGTAQSGGLAWWLTFSKRGTRRCSPIKGLSHYSASLGKFPPGTEKGGFDQMSNLRLWKSSVVLGPGLEHPAQSAATATRSRISGTKWMDKL